MQVRIHMLFEFIHKYCVTLNDNLTLFQPNCYILKTLFETLKVDTLLTFNVLSMDIKSPLYIYFDADILTTLTYIHILNIASYFFLIFAPPGMTNVLSA